MARASSKAKQDYYARYKASNKWKSNRLKKLERQLKLQPNNAEQIEAAMANVNYRRKKPTNTQWSASDRRAAQLLKLFCGSAPIECFSSNRDVAAKTIAGLHRELSPKQLPQGKVDFSLGARLQGAR